MNSSERQAYRLPTPSQVAALVEYRDMATCIERWGHLMSPRQLGHLAAEGRGDAPMRRCRAVQAASTPAPGRRVIKPSPAPRIDPIVDKIRATAAEGHSRIAISEILGISAKRVGDIVKTNDIPIRVPPKILPPDAELLVFIETTPDLKTVARWYGVSSLMLEARLRGIQARADRQALRAAKVAPAPVAVIVEVAPVPVVARRARMNKYELAEARGQLNLFSGIPS